MDDHFVRTMSISHREFFRLLPRAVDGFDFTIQDRDIFIQLGDGRLEVRISEEGERRLASLKLPMINLDFTFSGVDDSIKADFLAQFDLAYQRGGG